MHKFDEYLPKDERGRAQVSGQLEALEGENRALPTHFDAGHSYVVVERVRGSWEMVDRDADVEGVKGMVEGMMRKYEEGRAK